MKSKFVSIITKIIVILVIILVGVFAAFIYSNAKEGNDPKEVSKIEEEIIYLDGKITTIINALNGIQLENYKITINQVQEEQSKSNSSEKEKSSKEGENENQEEEKTSKKEQTITSMEKEQIVEDVVETNWVWIKGETEMLYTVWPTIVLDLYEIKADTNKIVEFSTTIDNALISIKGQDKAKTAEYLAKLYSLLPEFTKTAEIEQIKKDMIQVKSNILNAYASVEIASWEKVNQEVLNAEKTFMQTMNTISKEKNQKKYNINKAYILIEELKNSISTKDSGIFHLKYKNLLEELNTLL